MIRTGAGSRLRRGCAHWGQVFWPGFAFATRPFCRSLATAQTAALTAAIRPRTAPATAAAIRTFGLHRSTNGDPGCIQLPRLSAEMMTEDAKFALGF